MENNSHNKGIKIVSNIIVGMLLLLIFMGLAYLAVWMWQAIEGLIFG